MEPKDVMNLVGSLTFRPFTPADHHAFPDMGADGLLAENEEFIVLMGSDHNGRYWVTVVNIETGDQVECEVVKP